MRRLYILYLVLFLICVSYFTYRFVFRVPPLPATPPAVEPALPTGPAFTPLTVEHNGQTYVYDIITIDDVTRLSLIANFDKRTDAESLMQEHECASGINGGFYDTQNKPLGLFITDGKTLRGQADNRLINGFVSVMGEKAVISSNPPGATVRLSLQTGPLLLSDGSPLPLAIRNDEPARRMVAAITPEGTLHFLTIYDADGVFLGPLLGDLPAIIDRINTDKNLEITNAVNLDGGSASMFITTSTRLSELTPIGSLFCIN